MKASPDILIIFLTASIFLILLFYDDVGDGAALLPEHLSFGTDVKDRINLDAPLHEIAESAARFAEKSRIENALRQTHGNKSRAAEILKVSYKTLLNKIKEYGIQ